MPVEPSCVINRAVIVVLPRQPFVDWINAADPYPESVAVTLTEARDGPSAFLIPVNDKVDEPGKRWVQRNWEAVFEQMLNDWYVDATLWPRHRTLKMFKEWCEIHIHEMVFDYAVTPLEYAN
ncbi:hypothetical protein [Pandoraea soli]|uniref:Uncharacterized protein n=1 Tax=Pandoraea soli TaxID=2508293 RepID=A0ABY6W8Q9_9BURK|nr:hypothetical protein [Pandoraea soli]VVE13134.1 hypothetical protein PSO31014_02721 [Pandoraea soli]